MERAKLTTICFYNNYKLFDNTEKTGVQNILQGDGDYSSKGIL